jgi:hypothetical protein
VNQLERRSSYLLWDMLHCDAQRRSFDVFWSSQRRTRTVAPDQVRRLASFLHLHDKVSHGISVGEQHLVGHAGGDVDYVAGFQLLL